MPYSQKTNYGTSYDIIDTGKKNGDSICVQHCIKAINGDSQNGRMALIVPDGFLFDKKFSRVREYLLERCQLHSIISLPQGVFPYTGGVKTNIIYATKVNKNLKAEEKRKDYWYFTVKSDGYTLDNHRRKLNTPSDLIKYEEYRVELDNNSDKEVHKEMLQVGFEIIPLDKVRENSFILTGNMYREIRNEPYQYESKKLSEISTFIRGITFPKSAQKIEKSTECLGIVTTKAAQTTGIVNDDIIFLDNSYTKDEKVLQEGDILISLANSLNIVGRTTYVSKQHEGLSFGAFMGVIRADKRKVIPKMLYYLLNSDVAKQYFLANAKTTTNISNLTFKDLEDLVFPLPPLAEQKEIIREIELIDAQITDLKKTIELFTKKIRDRINEICS